MSLVSSDYDSDDLSLLPPLVLRRSVAFSAYQNGDDDDFVSLSQPKWWRGECDHPDDAEDNEEEEEDEMDVDVNPNATFSPGNCSKCKEKRCGFVVAVPQSPQYASTFCSDCRLPTAKVQKKRFASNRAAPY